jgi:hypothetical protein
MIGSTFWEKNMVGSTFCEENIIDSQKDFYGNFP